MKVQKAATAGTAALLFAAAAFVVQLYARIRLIDIPLDRDEGLWGYAAQEFLRGIPLYAGAYDTKLPGVTLIYSLFMALFGQEGWAIRLSAITFTAATGVLVFFTASKFTGRAVSAAAAGFYWLFSVSSSFQGVSAYTEHYAAFFIMASVNCALSCGNASALFSGLLAAAAILCKQQALFIAAVPFLLCLRERGKKLLPGFIAGLLLPMALLGIYIWLTGGSARFVSMIFSHSMKYASLIQMKDAAASFGMFVRWLNPGTALFGAMTLLSFAAAAMKARGDRWSSFTAMLCAASLLSAAAGLQFRAHYFLFVIPAAALACAWLLGAYAAKKRLFAAAVVILASSALLMCYFEKFYLFTMDQAKTAVSYYGANPFAAAEQVGRYLRSNTAPGARIAVLGSEPELLFYSRRRSATPYLSWYDLMWAGERSGPMQAEAISQIEAARPEYVCFVNMDISWRILPSSDRSVFKWYEGMRAKRMELAAVADIISPGRTVFAAGEQVKNYRPESGYRIDVYRVVR